MNGQQQQEDYTVEQLLKAVSAYGDSFDDQVPLDLLTAAASSFRSKELMKSLLQRIDNNSPVGNWSEFTLSFLSRTEETA
ncbi:MAG: hypothetical protein MRY76_01015 [Pseudomonadales bacterium]|nr:hypothetical protein [Pseudomonadales bacterium]